MTLLSRKVKTHNYDKHSELNCSKHFPFNPFILQSHIIILGLLDCFLFVEQSEQTPY